MLAAPPPAERPLLGVALRCLTATSFAVMGAFMKYASDRGATVDDLIFYRSVGALPVVVGWALLHGGAAAVRTRQPLKHLTRCCIGLVSMVAAFGALALLPIATAVSLSYSSAISATVLSALVLREEVGSRRWIAVVVGFLGVLLVTRPGGGHVSTFGVIIALFASLGQAAVAITLRQIGKTESPSAIVFWFTLFTTAAAAAALPWLGVRHGPGLTMILLSGGVLGGIGQLASTASVRFAPVAVVVPFDYLQIIWATLIGWFLFATPPTATMLAGAALIAASGIYTAYRERQRGLIPAEAAMVPEP
ncbi:drug/metabolite transporter (DMT)-like permease [Sphingomonas vulcanisoli]|uniref:Drug/metabolite transporter (DMT)-like permease n=1 Tax=Sphingomonas vulcanisoli TaxID=1658060 RepID=A0ABX0TPU0_9SPHN|nr:DMT family transporter [Sphingomonas vulcanisoli]NIJ06635.1 drug/metabolite transporter (DMT)-like permease [Sphingomonas vulcanisoli]